MPTRATRYLLITTKPEDFCLGTTVCYTVVMRFRLRLLLVVTAYFAVALALFPFVLAYTDKSYPPPLFLFFYALAFALIHAYVRLK
jgi:hypothetical protein